MPPSRYFFDETSTLSDTSEEATLAAARKAYLKKLIPFFSLDPAPHVSTSNVTSISSNSTLASHAAATSVSAGRL